MPTRLKMETRLKEIIIDLQEVREELGLSQVRDECLLTEAVKIYLSDKIQSYKEKNIQTINKGNPNLATDKQKNFLKKLGYNKPMDNLTMLEAKKLIESLVKKNDY